VMEAFATVLDEGGGQITRVARCSDVGFYCRHEMRVAVLTQVDVFDVGLGCVQ
jgi:hypothetical protein